MTTSRTTRWFWLSAAIVVADRASKLAIESYTTESFRHTLIDRVAYLVHSRNPGIAFGLLADSHSRWLAGLLVLSSLAVITLLMWLLAADRAGGRLACVGLALILGGAIGNLIDRLLHGSVVDFLEVWLGSYRWPAFNVADSAISIGAALVVLELLLGRRQPTEEKA